MTIAASNLATALSDVSASSYNTASVTPTPNALELLWVRNSLTATAATVPTVTGAGLNWVQVATVVETAGKRRTTLFRAMGPSPSTGALTISFGATAQDRCAWSLAEITGIDTSGADGSGAVVQAVTGFVDTGMALSITLAALSHPANATAGGIGTSTDGVSAQTITPGSGYSEVGQVDSVGQGMESEFRATGSTTVNWTYTLSAPSYGIGVEIAASPSGRRPIAPTGAVQRAASW